jgi:hypothetical protein
MLKYAIIVAGNVKPEADTRASRWFLNKIFFLCVLGCFFGLGLEMSAGCVNYRPLKSTNVNYRLPKSTKVN